MKIKKIILVIMAAILLCSCIQRRTSDLYTSEISVVNSRLNQLIDVIENKDYESFSGMFSEKALTEIENIDTGIDYIFSLVQGDIVSWENDTWGSRGEVKQGTELEKIYSWSEIVTNQGKYLVFMIENVGTENYDEQIGLYSLRIIHAENEDEEFGFWTDMEIPGIYIPEDMENGSSINE